MAELLAILFPILVVDVMNPVLLGVLIFAAGTDRPFANSAALLLGHTIAYFFAGIAASFGVEKISAAITEFMQNPGTTYYVVSLAIGIWCLVWALKPNRQSATDQEMPTWELTPLKCLGFGAIVNFVGVPFALPYFAAVDQILKAGLPFESQLHALIVYNAGYALPFSVVPVAILVMGERSKPLLERMNQWMTTTGASLMVWLIGLLGVWLVFESGYFFITGERLV